jgi:hypothetical protein
MGLDHQQWFRDMFGSPDEDPGEVDFPAGFVEGDVPADLIVAEKHY